MKIRDLKEIVATLDDEMEVVVEWFDHSFVRADALIEKVEIDDGNYYEPSLDAVVLVDVLVIR